MSSRRAWRKRVDPGAVRRARRWNRGLAGGLFLLSIPVMADGTALAAQELDVDRSAKRTVRFISRAAIDDFEGVTDKIDGYVLLPEGGLQAGPLGDGSEFLFEVDLASLDTGIGLRNRHMRDNYLETGKYPYARYTGQLVRAERGSSGAFRVDVSGQMEIHGVRHALAVSCDVAPEGAGRRVKCVWPIRLSDYAIDIPRFMFLKISEEVRLEVDFAVRPLEGGGA